MLRRIFAPLFRRSKKSFTIISVVGIINPCSKCTVVQLITYKFAWLELQKHIKRNAHLPESLRISVLATMEDLLSEFSGGQNIV